MFETEMTASRSRSRACRSVMRILPRLATLAFILMCIAPGTAGAVLLWQADTARGTSVFEGLERSPGIISVTNDPKGIYGDVYRYDTWDDRANYDKQRCESKGTKTPTGNFRMTYGNEYYIGWRSMWTPMPVNGSWVAFFQMHGYGPSGQGAPLVLRCVNGDGKLYMQNGVNGDNTNFWNVPFRTNVWQSFVVRVLLSTNKTEGFVEIWYDGVKQTFANGQQRFYCSTVDAKPGSYVLLKWGVYRSGTLNGKGPASAFMSRARVGTTYEDVAENPFMLNASPATHAVPPGDAADFDVSMIQDGPGAGLISLSVSGLPPDSSASFAPNSVFNAGTSLLHVTTSESTPQGSYPLTIQAIGGGVTNLSSVKLIVTTNSIAPPGTLIWSGAGGQKTWIEPDNWINPGGGGVGSPGPANNVVFTNLGTTTALSQSNSLVDPAYTGIAGVIHSLQYANTNTNYHATFIMPGQTLAISNYTLGMALGAGTLSDLGTNTTASVTAAITGADGQFDVFAPNGYINVGQGGSSGGTAVGAQRATLDLSGLGSFDAIVGRVLIGAREGAGLQSRACGVLYLARQTTLFATSIANDAILIGDQGSGNGSGLASGIYLGSQTFIYADSIIVGRRKAHNGAFFSFNPAVTNAGCEAVIRGNSAGRVALYAVGDASLLNTTQSSIGTNDFSGGTVDLLADTLILGRSATSSATAVGSGILTFTDGVIDANTIEAGYQNGSASPAFGIINVRGPGAELIVNTTMRLGRANGGTAQGTLNVHQGAANLNRIIDGGGASAVNITGGTLVLANDAGTPSAPIDSVSLTNASLRLAIKGAAPATNIVAATLNAAGVNTVSIDEITNVAVPASVRLIAYAALNGSIGNFAVGALPPGYAGTISNSAVTGTIDLHLTAAPLEPPVLSATHLSGGTLQLHGSGIPFGAFHLLTSTNIALPLHLWTPVLTNAFDENGAFNLPLPVDPGAAGQFYRLVIP